MSTVTERDSAASRAEELSLIDCDVHPVFPSEWQDTLAPYASREWRVRLTGSSDQYEGTGGAKDLPSVRYGLPTNPFYPKSGGNLRLDLLQDGPLPGVDPQRTAAELLDAGGADRALLLPQGVLTVGSFPTADIAATVASATNAWLADQWLAEDRRWKGVLAVAPQDPEAAVREIERWADDDRFAAVFISLGRPMLGDAHYYPIYAAAQHHELPVVIHPNGTEGIYAGAPQTAGAPPAYHLDFRISFQHPYQMSLASLVANGVFERFPRLRFAYTECGFAWLPDLLWRLDAYWRGAREETPWVKRPPSEYILERVRFTTQPMIEPRRRSELAEMLEMVDGGRTLMFSTDYPHWDADVPDRIARDIPGPMRSRILAENALEHFGPRLRS
jgi:predicted TIM-barrel fold metal-dependent hydrolase